MRFIVALALLVVLPTAAQTQERERRPSPPSVTVTAEGIVTAAPDQAEIEIGVVTESKTAAQAAKENAAKLAQVVAEIKKLLGAGDEIKTVSYSVSPTYRYPKDGKPEISGYTATNVAQVKTRALQGVGNLIDAATQSGANRIQRLVFTLKDEDAAKREALRSATAKAKAKAEDMARALGLKIARVLSVTEGAQVFQPMVRARNELMQAQAAPTPVESGTVEIRSSVTLTAELAGQ